MTTVTHTELPMILAEVDVVSARRISSSFVRIVLGGAPLAEMGVDGPLYDQRFKIIVPAAGGGLPSVVGADETWVRTWMERPVEERGYMRTYTVRAVEGAGHDTRVVVDVVVHADGDPGPGSEWALNARVGSRVVVLMPRRGYDFGGIEWAPPVGSDLLLVGDETAVPAVCAILECLPQNATGAAFLEVPHVDDLQDVRPPPGLTLTWLPRDGRPHGEALHRAVLAHLDAPSIPPSTIDDVAPDLWETPTWSSSGEALTPAGGPDPGGLYAWIAGEAGTVTALRRQLVAGWGVDRRRVAFMGYWRRGVAMRS